MTCLTQATEFAALHDTWMGLLRQRDLTSIFLTPQWQEAWWDQFRNGSRELRLLVVGDESGPLGLAPMMAEGDTLSFLGSTDLFDYHDFIMGAGEPQAFYPMLARCLDNVPWKTLDLESIAEDSPTLQYLPEQFRQAGYDVSVEREDVVPGMHLPSSWDDYLAGLRKKDRHELRRKLRRLNQAGSWEVVASTKATLDADLDDFMAMMQESREEKRDFLVPERAAFFRSVAHRMDEEGYLKLTFLEIEGERVAAVVAFDCCGRRMLYNSGYRLSYGAYSVGLLLKALSIQDAIEQGLSYFDYLRGAEPYKYHLGAEDKGLFRMVVRR